MSLVVKNLPANAGYIKEVGLILESRRSPGLGHAIHSNILAWKIPWSEEPGRLWSVGLHRVWHNWSNVACTHARSDYDSDFRAQGKKICYCFHFFLSVCHEVIGLDALILVFWKLSFKWAFSLISSTLIKRLFSSSLLSAIRVVSSAYLRLLIFFWKFWFQFMINPVWHFAWYTLHIS